MRKYISQVIFDSKIVLRYSSLSVRTPASAQSISKYTFKSLKRGDGNSNSLAITVADADVHTLDTGISGSLGCFTV